MGLSGVTYNSVIGVCCRYAFVHYKSSAECKKGHDTAQGKSVRGQPILVQYAKKSSKKQTNKGLYVYLACRVGYRPCEIYCS